MGCSHCGATLKPNSSADMCNSCAKKGMPVPNPIPAAYAPTTSHSDHTPTIKGHEAQTMALSQLPAKKTYAILMDRETLIRAIKDATSSHGTFVNKQPDRRHNQTALLQAYWASADEPILYWSLECLLKREIGEAEATDAVNQCEKLILLRCFLIRYGRQLDLNGKQFNNKAHNVIEFILNLPAKQGFQRLYKNRALNMLIRCHSVKELNLTGPAIKTILRSLNRNLLLQIFVHYHSRTGRPMRNMNLPNLLLAYKSFIEMISDRANVRFYSEYTYKMLHKIMVNYTYKDQTDIWRLIYLSNTHFTMQKKRINHAYYLSQANAANSNAQHPNPYYYDQDDVKTNNSLLASLVTLPMRIKQPEDNCTLNMHNTPIFSFLTYRQAYKLRKQTPSFCTESELDIIKQAYLNSKEIWHTVLLVNVALYRDSQVLLPTMATEIWHIILRKITAYEKDPTTARAEIEASEAIERIRFFISPPAGNVKKNFSTLKKIALALDKRQWLV